MRFPYCLLLACAIRLVAATPGSIIEGPESRNISLGSNVTFTCLASGQFLTWEVDGFKPSQVELKNRGISTRLIPRTDSLLESVLQVPGTLQNNNSHVQCASIGDDHQITPYTNGTVLKIQGLLGHVSQLMPEFVEQSLKLSWTAPYSLSGVDILGYDVSMSGTDSSSLFNQEVSQNFALVPIADLVSCHNYSINITGRNAVGNGLVSSFQLSYPGAPELSNTSVDVLFIRGTTTRNIRIRVQAIGSCPQQYPTLATGYLKKTNNLTESICFNFTTTGVWLLADVQHISVDTHFSFDVFVQNSLRSSWFNNTINISTFDSQDILFGRTNDSQLFCAACRFLTNSNSKGCSIEVTPTSMNTTQRATSTKPSTESQSKWVCFTLTNNLHCNLAAYDIEEDGRVSTEVAVQFPLLIDYSQLPIIIGVSPSPSPTQSVVIGIYSKPTPVGLIAGCVVGAMVFCITILMLIIVGSVCIKKRRQEQTVSCNAVGEGIDTSNNIVYDYFRADLKLSATSTDSNFTDTSWITTADNPVYAGAAGATAVYETVGHGSKVGEFPCDDANLKAPARSYELVDDFNPGMMASVTPPLLPDRPPPSSGPVALTVEPPPVVPNMYKKM